MNEMGVMIATHIPALVMMIVGYALLVVEMYVPGFGLPGISGNALMTIGIIAMEPTPLQALLLVLNEALNQKKESDSAEDLSYFVGRCGRTHTALRPAGIAEFDGVKLNVVSDGDFIADRRFVRVERVEGNRIVVREADEHGNLL